MYPYFFKILLRIVFGMITMLNAAAFAGYVYHCETALAEGETEYQWQEEGMPAFDELIMTWNGQRPKSGHWQFWISVKIGETWSAWLPYMYWGVNFQKSFETSFADSQVRTYQDAIELQDGCLAHGFRVKAIGSDSAHLKELVALHVYLKTAQKEVAPLVQLPNVSLAVGGLSQMALDHPRARDLCSATSTTAVVRYLGGSDLDPRTFAEKARDEGFDIYGNWVLNCAQAFAELKGYWRCYVAKLDNLNQLFSYLVSGYPVVVSVRGPLKGSAALYRSGHLIVVIGYDPVNDLIICMDPAFPEDSQTQVVYERLEFIQAWERRGKVAYLFEQNTSSRP